MTIKNSPANTGDDVKKRDREKRERDQFHESTIGVFKAMSRKPSNRRKKPGDNKADANDIQVSFSHKARGSLSRALDGSTRLTLRRFEENKDKDIIRGQADHFAFRRKYHEPERFREFDLAQTFGNDSEVAQLFKILDNIRTDAIGSRQMRGVAKNIRSHFENDFLNRHDQKSFKDLSASEKRTAAFELILMEKLTGIPLSDKLNFYTAPFRNKLENVLEGHEEALIERLDNADDYYRAGLEFLQDLFPDMDFPEPPPSETEASENDQENEAPQEDEPDNDQQEDQDNQARGEDEENEQDQDGNELEQEMPDQQGNEGTESNQEQSGGGDEEEYEQQGEETQGSPSGARPSEIETDPLYAGYKVYTTQFDEIVHARDLIDPLEMKKLKRNLEDASSSFKDDIRGIGNRLKRFLMAQNTSSWAFDLEEGNLDPSRLARIVANPSTPLAFKQEKVDDMMDTLVTILVDNSGSMRGRPITIAATCTDMLSRTLEQCNVKTEILGYTTKSWKGGQSKELWLRSGKPPNPGRLNDLRHIIYKPADMPLRACRDNFAIMLRDGLLKENIDGESLIWAYKRILKRPEKRKILIVISDGAPVDDSTNSVNKGENKYLSNHLKHVIKGVEADKNVELSAIGIGHDVTTLYSNSIHISNADELAATLANKVLLLFADQSKPGNKRMLARARKQMKRL